MPIDRRPGPPSTRPSRSPAGGRRGGRARDRSPGPWRAEPPQGLPRRPRTGRSTSTTSDLDARWCRAQHAANASADLLAQWRSDLRQGPRPARRPWPGSPSFIWPTRTAIGTNERYMAAAHRLELRAWPGCIRWSTALLSRTGRIGRRAANAVTVFSTALALRARYHRYSLCHR